MGNDNTQKKRGRGRPPLTDEQKKANKLARQNGEMPPVRNLITTMDNFAPGDNSKYIQHALITSSMPRIDVNNSQEVADRLDWYFNHCVSSDMKPTVNGMCNALGIHRTTLHAWRTGEYRKGTHQEIVLSAYRLLEELWENYMLNGKINPVSGIFLAKNMFEGYSDQQDIVISPKAQRLSDADPDIIAAKYDELPED